MKLDPTVMRTMSKEDYRVMEAIEIGMKDHEIVPTALITTVANLRYGGVTKRISSLHRDKLISHEKFNGIDGYRLTNAGYDILALYNLKVRHIIAAIGQKIGTGKESDIYLAADPTGKQVVLKFHRLGRTSFRNVRNKRDYFNNAKGGGRAHSWLFLSKLSATKEYAFMKALYDVEYPTPQPLGQNRHIICMGLIRGIPLYQIYPKQLSVEQAQSIYEQAVALATTLAINHGLVHCDLNEYNLLVDLSGIQQRATDDTADPYVRNSGAMSVRMTSSTTNSKATNNNDDANSISLLSRPLPWLKDDGIVAHMNELPTIRDAAEEEALNNDPLPEPVSRLPNGEPRPVVTLIDFPQMISIQHYNVRDYYERDMECLHRFFTKKLQCIIPDIESKNASTSWDNILKIIESNKLTTDTMDPSTTNDIDDGASIFSSSLSVTTRRRLDEELKASGYYSSGYDKDLELYYFESISNNNTATATGTTNIIPEEGDDDNDEEEEKGDSDDDDNDNDDDNSRNNNDVGMQPLHSGDENENDTDTDDHSSLGNDDHLDDNGTTTKQKKQSKNNNGSSNVTISGIDKLELLSLATEQRAKLTREEMIELAKERITKQIDNNKKKTKLKSSTNFKARNNNKAVSKGKQILTDYGY